MHHYEFNFLISPNLANKELDSLVEKINSLIQEGGKIFVNKKIQRRKLAFLIKKEGEAWLYSLKFIPKESLQKNFLKSLEKELKQKKEILRYLILKKERKLTKEKKYFRQKPKEKVELEEIEKKLEEILEE